MKFPPIDLNLSSCPSYPTITYTCGMTIIPRCAMVKRVTLKFSYFFSSFSHFLFFSYLCQEYSFKNWGKEHLRDKNNCHLHIKLVRAARACRKKKVL